MLLLIYRLIAQTSEGAQAHASTRSPDSSMPRGGRTMRRIYPFIPLVTLVATLVLLPRAASAAGPHQHDLRWVGSTPLDDLSTAYLAESPRHGFDAWIAPDGVRAQAVDGAWQLGLALVAVGRDGAMKQAEPAGVEARGNRAELHRGWLHRVVRQRRARSGAGFHPGGASRRAPRATSSSWRWSSPGTSCPWWPGTAGVWTCCGLVIPCRFWSTAVSRWWTPRGFQAAGPAGAGSRVREQGPRAADRGGRRRCRVSGSGGSAARHRGLGLPRNGRHQ